MDVHVKRAVTEGLRLRGVDVLTAQEDGTAEFEDPETFKPCGRTRSYSFHAGRRPPARGK